MDAAGPEVDPERTPKSMQVKLQFPARGQQPKVTLHWSHGTPAILKQKNIPTRGANTLFIGNQGMMVCGFDQYKLLPEDKFADFTAPEPSIAPSPGFHKEWITPSAS